tara:strand:- start:561 stop:1016 length:456 start_codon:yes stop_codon:yes gene_type:complete
MNKKATWMALFGALGFLAAIIISFTTIQTPFNPDALVVYEPLGTTELEIYQTYQTGEVCSNFLEMSIYNSATKSTTDDEFRLSFSQYLQSFNEYCNSTYEVDDFTIKHSISNNKITYTVETPIPITFTRNNYVYELPVYYKTTVDYSGNLL